MRGRRELVAATVACVQQLAAHILAEAVAVTGAAAALPRRAREPRMGEPRAVEPVSLVRRPRRRAAGRVVGGVLPQPARARRVAVEVERRPARRGAVEEPAAARLVDRQELPTTSVRAAVTPLGSRFDQIEAARRQRELGGAA